MSTFDARLYWEDRLGTTYSLDGVGHRGCGTRFNQMAYRARGRAFRRAVRKLGVDLRTADALDIGSGTGFYLDRWHEVGAHSVSGADLTETATNALRQKFPRDTIYHADIGQDISAFEGKSFDLVSCMDVLFHIVDDNAYARALRNVRALLKPGGHFVFTEAFMSGTERRASYLVHRHRSSVEEHLRSAGLVPVWSGPFLVLMNDPVEHEAKTALRWWRAVSSATKRSKPADFVLSRVLYPIEIAAARLLRFSPSTEIMVCRRADDAPKA